MKPISTETVHLAIVDAEQGLAPQTPARPRVGLGPIDQLALKALVSDNPETAIEHARGLADALAGPDSAGARLRTLARAIAATETQRALLETVLMQRLAKRDGEGVEMIDRVLRSLTVRTARLIEAHRAESQGQHRAVTVAVGHADSVTITGAGED